MKFATVSNS